MSDEIRKLVFEDSPWHDPANKEWFRKDGALREVIKAEEEGLSHPPKIKFTLQKYFFDQIFSDPKKYGIIILRGPRRTGKTSTVKYLIKEYLEKGFDPKSFVYLSLDKDELFVEDEKKKFLRELIKRIVNNYKQDNKPLILILDEVTFYKGWPRALKNLIDEGVIAPGVGVIATGSYSLDLSSAKRELAGRFGPLGEQFEGDIFFYPRRFIEIAESLLGSSFKSFVQRNFGKYGKKVGMLEYLSGNQTEVNNVMYNYEQLLQKLLNDYYDSLHDLFANVYLYAGGYPKSFYEAVTTQRTGNLIISDARFRDDIYNLLVTDGRKFELSEDHLKDILQKISFPSMQTSENYFKLPGIKKGEVENYLSYLEASGLFSFIPCVSLPEQVDPRNMLVSPNKNTQKLIVTDPAAYIAIYTCVRGMTTDILRKIQEVFSSNSKMKGLLFESVLISHLIRSPLIKKSFLIKNIGFVSFNEEELADAFAWYVNWKNKLILVAVEAKSGDIDIGETRKTASILKEKFNVSRLIVVSNSKEIKIEQDYAILPLEIFLLFL